jgi:hypothetical protein
MFPAAALSGAIAKSCYPFIDLLVNPFPPAPVGVAPMASCLARPKNNLNSFLNPAEN